jgi:hypothetical protein
METLENERFSLDIDGVRGGAPWVTDLFILQRSFETKIRERDINGVKDVSDELLTKCRHHLYHIDKRLLRAVKELDHSCSLFPPLLSWIYLSRNVLAILFNLI